MTAHVGHYPSASWGPPARRAWDDRSCPSRMTIPLVLDGLPTFS